MFNNLATYVGGLLILLGLILLTRKKFMLKEEYYIMIFVLIPIGYNPLLFTEGGYETIGFIIICILPIVGLNIMFIRGRYLLTNIKKDTFVSALISILDEKEISYEKKKKGIILKDYNDKQIKYTPSLNTINVNFQEIMNMNIYKDLVTDLKSRIQKMTTKAFPLFGVYLIVAGILYIVLYQYLNK